MKIYPRFRKIISFPLFSFHFMPVYVSIHASVVDFLCQCSLGWMRVSVSQKGVLNSLNRLFKYKNRMLKYTPLPYCANENRRLMP